MLTYLIDGNNVIRTNPDLNKVFLENPEDAKNYLINKVLDYFRNKNNKATIFFDGFNFIHSFTQISNNVSIKHAKDKTADEVILVTIEKSKNTKNLVIVTSDLALISKAKLYKCHVITSTEFLQKIFNQKNKDEFKPSDLSSSEINYWLRLFNNAKKNED
ncbi:MAG: NYN domain-containing protein [Ignavibacteria bacterium]|nr:NYN domain-containing protein [Ignavibacteria bacterium]